jgi:hypothetical protein
MSETNKEEKPPFNVGDLVVIRNKDLKLRMFQKHKANDVGVVMNITKTKQSRWKAGEYIQEDKWRVTVMWQQYSGYNYHGLPVDTTNILHTRLKKVA